MKSNLEKILFALGTVIFFIAVADGHGQTSPLGGLKDMHATDFTSTEYFEPPDNMKVKMRLSGAEALPLTNSMLDVKQLKVEMFGTNGNPQVVVRAPQCTYSYFDHVANSSGPLELIALDGKLHVAGEGFLWRQAAGSLIISNHVRTTIAVDIFADKKTAL